jgi:hypothetical protein
VYGVAWIFFVGVLVVLGLLVAFVVLASPIFAFIALIVAAIAGAAYLASRRTKIGTERERVARGETTPDAAEARRRAAPEAGEGSAAGGDEREGYEPAV